MVFDDSYEQAWDSAYRGLTPANRYNVDYSMLGTARVEPLLRRIRNAMMDAGMVVEDSKGECNFGQHEINFLLRRRAARRRRARRSTRTRAKEIAAQEGKAITFMAKFDEREGNSCHIHLSLRGDDGSIVFDDEEGLFDRFLAGMLAGLRELTLFLAPNINSYKRFAALLLRADHGGVGPRQPHVRAARRRPRRRPARSSAASPGADVNPYLALSALIAAGLHGVDAELELEPALRGQRLRGRPSARRCPATLRDARDLFAASAIARDAFGQEVVDHYLNNARVELEAFDAAVTDWERFRGFERL